MSIEQAILPPVPAEEIRADIKRVKDRLLFASGDYEVYLLRSSEAPSLMQELYRLREETFRAIGEGTGLPQDTDSYDAYYRQMILWNVPNGEIAGAYRLGFGSEILKAHGGIDGFYTASLFRYSPEIEPLLGQCIELGRSFLVGKYQREIFTLKLLLGGLAVSSLYCPEGRYYMGPVSMSAAIPSYYQTLAIHFLRRDFAFPNADKLVACTHPFVEDPECREPGQLLQDVPAGDIDAFDHRMAALSDGQYRLPVLFRKYFSCGARVSCVNVDPDFSDCVDAMIVLRLADFPPASIKSFIRSLPQELQDEVLRHFYGSENV